MLENKEKQILVSLITTIFVHGIYCTYVYKAYVDPNPAIINDFSFWGKAFLFLIPIAIAAQIVIHIVFAIINKIITNEDIPTISDERDKLIELKATKIAHWTYVVFFLLAMCSQAMGMQPYVMFLFLVASGFTACIAESIAQIYFYRKGF